MLNNYIKTAIRSLRKSKSISLINLLGLTISLASAFLILLWIQNEKSYDSYHNDVDRIYRIAFENTSPQASHKHANTTGALAVALRNDYSQVENVTRIMVQGKKIVETTPEKRFSENNFFLVDDDFFNIFSLPFIHGSQKQPFSGAGSIVVSQRIAQKYFGKENILGEIIKIGSNSVTVSGVIQDTPQNSHLHFDFLAPLKSVEKHRFFTDWSIQLSIFTFVKLKEGVDPKQFENTIKNISENYYGDVLARENEKERFFLQPMRDIYLYSNLDDEAPISGNILYVNIFYLTAFIILLIASINFVNLTTSKTSRRSKEIAMRKIVGADKRQIVWQLFLEIALMLLTGFLLAICLVEVVLPFYNNLTGQLIANFSWMNPTFLLQALGLMLLIVLVCAAYPVFLYSSFTPASILQSRFTGKNSFSLRKTLVVIQFALSIILIIGTCTIFQQLYFIKNKEIGFNKDHVLVVSLKAPSSSGLDFYEQVKSEFTNYKNISAACVSRGIPGDGGLLSFDAGLAKSSESDKQPFQFNMIDADFINMYEMELLAGRGFRNTISDVNNSCIINETACKTFGFAECKDALGKLFDPGYDGEKPLTIVGVCRDVHYESLHTAVEPMYFAMSPEWFENNGQRPFARLSLKINSDHISETLGFVKSKFTELFPNGVFVYYFLDDKVEQQYLQDERFATIFNIFTAFAIFIASLGLLGLAIFSTERRIKEIGLRKVLGASVTGIVALLSTEFCKWILLSNLIAWPIAWYAMNKWLQNFAYRIELTIWPFLLAGLAALFIALLTVSWQAIRAATANPVEALRYE